MDREALTPKTSNTFNVYAAAAYETAAELQNFAFMLRKRMTAEATARAQAAEDLETDLRELGSRFGAWPSMSPETVAFERYTLNLPGALLELREQAKLLMGWSAAGGGQPASGGEKTKA